MSTHKTSIHRRVPHKGDLWKSGVITVWFVFVLSVNNNRYSSIYECDCIIIREDGSLMASSYTIYVDYDEWLYSV